MLTKYKNLTCAALALTVVFAASNAFAIWPFGGKDYKHADEGVLKDQKKFLEAQEKALRNSNNHKIVKDMRDAAAIERDVEYLKDVLICMQDEIVVFREERVDEQHATIFGHYNVATLRSPCVDEKGDGRLNDEVIKSALKAQHHKMNQAKKGVPRDKADDFEDQKIRMDDRIWLMKNERMVVFKQSEAINIRDLLASRIQDAQVAYLNISNQLDTTIREYRTAFFGFRTDVHDEILAELASSYLIASMKVRNLAELLVQIDENGFTIPRIARFSGTEIADGGMGTSTRLPDTPKFDVDRPLVLDIPAADEAQATIDRMDKRIARATDAGIEMPETDDGFMAVSTSFAKLGTLAQFAIKEVDTELKQTKQKNNNTKKRHKDELNKYQPKVGSGSRATGAASQGGN